MSETVRHAVLVSAPLDRAFALFTQGFDTWWPREYTWSREKLDTIAIEPREGGRCFERGPEGFEADWGRVRAWEPPARLVFSWQIGPTREPVPDPDAASEVEVHFETADAQSTRVELEHRRFERHGEGGEGYAAAMGSEQGWPMMLDRYASAAGELAGGWDTE